MNVFATNKQLDDLLAARASAEELVKLGKAKIADLNRTIVALVSDTLPLAFKRADKVCGTVKFALNNETYKAEIEKNVSWDSEMLQSIAGSMEFGLAQEIFKVTYSVTETVFKDVDDKVRALLIPARTVRYSDPKITAAN